jgi:hypothetical protein
MVICLRWFRTKKRFGTCWALFALALQFALSFGHAHQNQLAEPFAASPQFSILDHAPSTTISASPIVPITPAGLALAYCEICAVANLAGNGVPPNPPQLCVRLYIRQIQFWLQDAAGFAFHRTEPSRHALHLMPDLVR